MMFWYSFLYHHISIFTFMVAGFLVGLTRHDTWLGIQTFFALVVAWAYGGYCSLKYDEARKEEDRWQKKFR